MTDRQVPPAEVNHAAFAHEQLKQWTDDADASTSQSFADEWAKSGAALLEAADALKRVSADSEAGWTGEAAEAMRARLAQISEWSSRTGTQIATASQGVGRQSEAADAARRAMPDPVPYDPARMIQEAQQGGLVDRAMLSQRMVAQQEAHDAAHAEAVRVVAERDSAMSGAAGEVELFEPPPGLGGSSSTSSSTSTFVGAGDVGGSGGGSAALPAPRAAGESGPGVSGSSESGRSFEPGSSESGPVPVGVVPAAAQTSGDGVGTPPSPDGTTPESFTSREPAVSGAPAFGPTPIPQQSGGSSPAFGPGSGVLGAAPAAGGALPGVSPGAAAAAARNGGMPIGGAARREDDAEHQRPEFLQEPDPDGIFDTDVRTAPSVIGGSDEG